MQLNTKFGGVKKNLGANPSVLGRDNQARGGWVVDNGYTNIGSISRGWRKHGFYPGQCPALQCWGWGQVQGDHRPDDQEEGGQEVQSKDR